MHNSIFQAKKLIIKDESCFELHASIWIEHLKIPAKSHLQLLKAA